jgi:hypothetical protein
VSVSNCGAESDISFTQIDSPGFHGNISERELPKLEQSDTRRTTIFLRREVESSELVQAC